MLKTLFKIIAIVSLSNLLYSQDIKWWYDTKDGCFGQTASADLDGDEYLELVFGCYRNDGKVYALKSTDGSLLWSFFTGMNNYAGCNDAAPLIYDVNNDGKPEVIVASSCTPRTYCLSGIDGSIKWEASTRGSDSPPVIGDINGDGNLEILHGQFLGYVICIDAKTGNVNWEILVQENTWIQTAPTLVDIDGDGVLDFLVATWCLNKNDTNRLYAYRGYDRKIIWTYDLKGVVYHGTTVVDLDRDDELEVVIGDYSGTIYCLNAKNGTLKWTHSDPLYYYVGSPISVGDLDGDGFCDLVFSTASEIVALNYDGTLKWKYVIPYYANAFRGAVLADITDDKLLDVIFGTSKGNLIGLNGKNGTEIFNLNLAEHIGKEFDSKHSPIVTDFDKDGILDIFIIGGYTKYPEFQNNYGRAYCISLFKGYGPDWLMFQRNFHRNSSICSDFSSIFHNYTINSSNYEIYPNPFSRSFKIKSNERINEDIVIRLIDIYGRTIELLNSSVNLNNSEIEITADRISSGLYYVQIINGKEFVLKHLIKL